jgi:hypothetical protein
MITNTRHETVEELALKSLKDIEPNSDELDLFNATSEEYFSNPDQVLEGIKVEDKPAGIGFGIGEILLTPVLLWLGNKLLDLAWGLVKKPLEEELGPPVGRFIKKLLKKFGIVKEAKPTTFPPLTPPELQQLRQQALADSELKRLVAEYKLSDALAVKLVDTMIANIPTVSK